MIIVDSLSSIDTLNLIALLSVVFIGLPHGAMDGALAAHFGWMESNKKAAAFLAAALAADAAGGGEGGRAHVHVDARCSQSRQLDGDLVGHRHLPRQRRHPRRGDAIPGSGLICHAEGDGDRQRHP